MTGLIPPPHPQTQGTGSGQDPDDQNGRGRGSDPSGGDDARGGGPQQDGGAAAQDDVTVATREDLDELFEVQVVTPVPTPVDDDDDDGDDDPGDDHSDRPAPGEDDRGGPDRGALGADGPDPGGPDLGRGTAPGPAHCPRPPARPAAPALRWADLFGSWRPPIPVPTPHDLADLCRTPVIIAAPTLTSADEHPATVPAAGPLDAATVRRIAAHARYRWLHVDPVTGYLVHRDARAHPPPEPGHGWDATSGCAAVTGPPAPSALPATVSAAITHTGYVPGHLLRAHIQCREATCIGPACHHPARSNDLDHTIDYRDPDGRGSGGATTASNLGASCRRIHQSRTHGGWQLTQPTPGTFVWTSPLGLTHVKTARPALPGGTTLHAA